MSISLGEEYVVDEVHKDEDEDEDEDEGFARYAYRKGEHIVFPSMHNVHCTCSDISMWSSRYAMQYVLEQADVDADEDKGK